MKHNPETFITNKKFLQEGVAIYSVVKHEIPKVWTYPIGHRPDDYADTKNMSVTPLIYFGNSCPYIVSGEFEYSAAVFYWYSGAGSTFPISKEMMDDENWEECPIAKEGAYLRKSNETN